MIKEYEFTAKTIEQAIEKGLEELSVKQEDVDIDVVSDGGLFQKAKIIIKIEEKDEEYAVSDIQGDDLVISKPKEKERKNSKNKTDEIVETSTKEEKSFGDMYEESIKTVEVQEEKEVLEEINGENMKSVQFLNSFLKQINITAEIKVYKSSRGIKISLVGECAGNIIGHRGEGLNALQIIVNSIETKENRNADRVFLDIESYKERREENLKALAQRIAKKVIKSERRQRLEPMNSYERRIIHTELQNNPKIRTYSKGEEPNRYLIVEMIK